MLQSWKLQYLICLVLLVELCLSAGPGADGPADNQDPEVLASIYIPKENPGQLNESDIIIRYQFRGSHSVKITVSRPDSGTSYVPIGIWKRVPNYRNVEVVYMQAIQEGCWNVLVRVKPSEERITVALRLNGRNYRSYTFPLSHPTPPSPTLSPMASSITTTFGYLTDQAANIMVYETALPIVVVVACLLLLMVIVLGTILILCFCRRTGVISGCDITC